MRKHTHARVRLDGAGWAHPYSVTPWSPVLHADGGQGDGGQGGAPGGQPAGGDPDGGQGGNGDPAGQGGQDPNAPKPGEPVAAEGDESKLPAWAQKALADARKEAGKSRVTAKEKAAEEARTSLAQDIGRALGLVPDGEPADPAKLTEQLTASQAEARRTAVELAAYKAAHAEGARADRLLNSRSFADKLAELDPGAADFADQLKAAIKAETDADPDLYRAAPAGPPRGGAEFNGPPATDRKPSNLGEAIAARLGG
ncbi:hypothetical protein ACIGW3_11325 [Streptomyces sp. NPDC053499]|uniref:hypothetical protein n=1 Tax=Streptomyces sp. NPDC053499 TaxID=3365707 RepID=UPI0037D56508